LYVEHKDLGPLLIVSSYFNGTLTLALDKDKPGAHLLWRGNSESEIVTEGCTHHERAGRDSGGLLYGSAVMASCARSARYRRSGLNAGRDEIQAPSTDGVHGQARRSLVPSPTAAGTESSPSWRRTAITRSAGFSSSSPTYPNQGRIVNWTHPAYANKHIITRNDEEIVSYSLAADGKSE